MRRITISITQDDLDALVSRGRAEHRDPREQAAMDLHRSLEHMGYFSPASSPEDLSDKEMSDAEYFLAKEGSLNPTETIAAIVDRLRETIENVGMLEGRMARIEEASGELSKMQRALHKRIKALEDWLNNDVTVDATDSALKFISNYATPKES